MEVKWGGLNMVSKRIASMHFLSSFDTFLVKSLRFFLETLSLTSSKLYRRQTAAQLYSGEIGGFILDWEN